MKLIPLGDAALILELGETLSPEIHAQVMAAYQALVADPPPGLIELVPSYGSLCAHFDPLRIDREALAARLRRAAESKQKSGLVGRRIEIPVRFGGDAGPDLEDVAARVGRSAEEIIGTLCRLDLRVYVIGFLPGFPYLGELPPWLHLPRRATPRSRVPAGSVAIAGAQAAVYPWDSPGGWHLVGQTTLRLFDASDARQPALLAPGDSVRFVRV